MARTDKAAELREIAAKVREVAGACNKDGVWRACIVIGPLFKEAYEAGAWQREGSQIGDRLKTVSTDRQQLLGDGQTPVWKLEAWNAVVDPLVDHLIPVDGGDKANLEFEAGIAADEIEEEARRIEAASHERPDFSGATKHGKFYEFCWEQGLGEGCTERAMKPVRNDWNKKFGRQNDSTGRLRYPPLPGARACRKGYLEALKRAKNTS